MQTLQVLFYLVLVDYGGFNRSDLLQHSRRLQADLDLKIVQLRVPFFPVALVDGILLLVRLHHRMLSFLRWSSDRVGVEAAVVLLAFVFPGISHFQFCVSSIRDDQVLYDDVGDRWVGRSFLIAEVPRRLLNRELQLRDLRYLHRVVLGFLD